jgi:hypothetical protein
MSLLQQRTVIDRARLFGVVMTALGGAALILGIVQLVTEPFRPLHLVLVVVWVVFCGNGVRALVIARRRRIAFEAENGREAGKQKPIA